MVTAYFITSIVCTLVYLGGALYEQNPRSMLLALFWGVFEVAAATVYWGLW